LRLDFNVLWVDDQPDRVTAQIAAITKRMQAEGFQFNPKLCTSVDDVTLAIADDVFTDEVDLILVDWDLGNGVFGQDAIAEIRSSVQYKDVVFYSAQTAPADLRQSAFDKGLEGVYCASRDQLVDEVMGVFESLVKKVLDLDHARGIVMGATSDIDHMVNESLAAIYSKSDDAAKRKMLGDALGYVNKKAESTKAKAEKLATAASLADFFEAHMVFQSNDKLIMLGRALKSGQFSTHSGFRPKIRLYIEKVVPDRNILGHKVVTPAGKPLAIVDNKGATMTLEQTRELRRLILDLRGDFSELLAALQAHGDAPVGSVASPVISE